jgi:ABC-type polysaccharide/polyol phosphate export permease
MSSTLPRVGRGSAVGAGPARMVNFVTTYRELFLNLTLRDLRSKYRRSFLGWMWSLLNPLAYMTIYTIVFAEFLKQIPPIGSPSGIKVYALYLMCGLLPWNFFQSGILTSIGTVIGNAPLIKKTYFPRALLPAASVSSAFVSHLIEMALLSAILVGFGNYHAIEFLPLVLVLMLFVAMFSIGLGLALSAINVYFRDIEWFVTILFMAWFFLTPIIYTTSRVSGTTIKILKINPMTDGVFCFRSLLYDGRMFSLLEFGYFASAAIIALVAGALIFRKCEPQFAEEL